MHPRLFVPDQACVWPDETHSCLCADVHVCLGWVCCGRCSPQRKFMKLRIIGSNAKGEDCETPLIAYYWK